MKNKKSKINSLRSFFRNRKINPWIAATLILFGVLIFARFFKVEIHRRGFSSKKVGEVAILRENLSAEEEKAVRAFLKFKKIKNEVIPSGVPDVYGQELGVSFDKVQESMNKMRVFGPTYGTNGQKIELKEEDLKRYIKISKQTACQYCCGVKTLVKEDGSAACGCAHSIVMRGLAAYLIKNYPDKFSDEEVLAEINKWKKTFFPKQTLAAKFAELKKKGDKDVESLLQEFPDFLPKMVGGC